MVTSYISHIKLTNDQYTLIGHSQTLIEKLSLMQRGICIYYCRKMVFMECAWSVRVKQYHNVVIVFNYQLQISLFGYIIKTK